MKWQFFVRVEQGRSELERVLDGMAGALEPLVFAGAGCRDGMAMLVVGVPGRCSSFAGDGMADHRLGRGVARGAPCCGDEEWGEESGGEKAGESHGRPLGGYGGTPMLPRSLWDLHGNSGLFGWWAVLEVKMALRRAHSGSCPGPASKLSKRVRDGHE
jgi:hypothetical protein